MAKKLTKEEFIAKSVLKHGDLYNYDKVVYVNNSTKVDIQCTKHLIVFPQRPQSHMAGRGCPMCRYETTSINNTKSKDDFVATARSVHGDKYSYEQVNYVDCFTQVDIFCNKHLKMFQQKPTHHTNGRGCLICAGEKVKSHSQSLVLSTNEFVVKAQAVHGDLYSYVDVDYKKSSQKVSIWCNRHKGYFKQTPNNHLAGIGCASCAKTGYSVNKPGVLYVLTCGDITKVGITNLTAKARCSTISKSFGSEFEVKSALGFADGAVPDKIETSVLRILRSKYERPKAKFEGSSECFLNVNYNELLEIIKDELVKLQGNEWQSTQVQTLDASDYAAAIF